MAVFTTTPKNPLAWVAPPPQEGTSEAYELLIGSGFKLDIGDGYNLTIQPAEVEIQWTTPNKSAGGHNWPGVHSAVDVFLDIGDGFNLLIDDTNKLIIDPGRSETPWTEVTKRGRSIY